jgi:hypothetical protein
LQLTALTLKQPPQRIGLNLVTLWFVCILNYSEAQVVEAEVGAVDIVIRRTAVVGIAFPATSAKGSGGFSLSLVWFHKVSPF